MRQFVIDNWTPGHAAAERYNLDFVVYSAVNAATCYPTIDTGCGTVQQSSKSLTFLMFGAFFIIQEGAAVGAKSC